MPAPGAHHRLHVLVLDFAFSWFSHGSEREFQRCCFLLYAPVLQRGQLRCRRGQWFVAQAAHAVAQREAYDEERRADEQGDDGVGGLVHKLVLGLVVSFRLVEYATDRVAYLSH